YPYRDPRTNALITAGNLRVAPRLQHLYDYLIENQHIQQIRDYNPENLGILSKDVYRRMQEGDASWVHEVPPGVALLICQRQLLGFDSARFDTPPPCASVESGQAESGEARAPASPLP